EDFDYRLFCFGKNADAIRGGAMLRARFGWDDPRYRTKKPLEPPFAAQGTAFPPTTEAMRGIDAPTMVLGWLSRAGLEKLIELPSEDAAAADAGVKKEGDAEKKADEPIADAGKS